MATVRVLEFLYKSSHRRHNMVIEEARPVNSCRARAFRFRLATPALERLLGHHAMMVGSASSRACFHWRPGLIRQVGSAITNVGTNCMSARTSISRQAGEPLHEMDAVLGSQNVGIVRREPEASARCTQTKSAGNPRGLPALLRDGWTDQRTETAVNFPVLCAMKRIPCALSVSAPPAGYDHTC